MRKTSRWTVENVSISISYVADVIIVLFVIDANDPGARAVLSTIFVELTVSVSKQLLGH